MFLRPVCSSISLLNKMFVLSITIRLVGPTSYTIIDWITEHFPIIVKLFQRFPMFEKILNQIT